MYNIIPSSMRFTSFRISARRFAFSSRPRCGPDPVRQKKAHLLCLNYPPPTPYHFPEILHPPFPHSPSSNLYPSCRPALMFCLPYPDTLPSNGLPFRSKHTSCVYVGNHGSGDGTVALADRCQRAEEVGLAKWVGL